MNYQDFLDKKTQAGAMNGFEPLFMPDQLFDFQKALTTWAIKKGRAAIFADCGLGKTFCELVWAENIVRKTNKPVLILTPLAVSAQTIREGEKFGIECRRSHHGELAGKITVANYERLHKFNHNDFEGVVCDESSILKSFSGARKKEVTEFMMKIPYRLLATATSAPNDYIELGTSSEALGYMGYVDMLNRFFKNNQNNSGTGRVFGKEIKWRFKGHAELPFWRWVTSWARACRKPSDLGYDDGPFLLLPIKKNIVIVDCFKPREGMLFHLPATNLKEQREEKRITIKERCEKVAEILSTKNGEQSLVWCHLNDEGDLLEKMIPDSLQVSGSDSDEAKEEKLMAFANKELKRLITKPKIGAWGLNFQNCSHVVFFPSHSYEQYYQSIRRCWRFGQKQQVNVDIVMTSGEIQVMKNMQYKEDAAQKMFINLVAEMNNSLQIKRENLFTDKLEVPSWVSKSKL